MGGPLPQFFNMNLLFLIKFERRNKFRFFFVFLWGLEGFKRSLRLFGDSVSPWNKLFGDSVMKRKTSREFSGIIILFPVVR